MLVTIKSTYYTGEKPGIYTFIPDLHITGIIEIKRIKIIGL